MILRLQKPVRDFAADYDLVRMRRKMSQVRSTLAVARDRVITAYGDYESAQGSPDSISNLDFDESTAEALRGNYSHTYEQKALADLRSSAMLNCPQQVCPMCGIGSVSDLDHYLPKSRYPEFSVLALNLVPVCKRCNGLKLDLIGTESGRFFHAFFDDVSDVCGLLAVELEIANVGVIVEVGVNEGLPQDIYRNAVFQFENLGLREAYIAASVRELIDRIPTFTREYEIGGPVAVAYSARMQAKHFRKVYGPQYWKVALYEAIEASSSFCDGGFDGLSRRVGGQQ